MNRAFELLFSEGGHIHSLSENLEKCLVDLDLRPAGVVQEKIFLCSIVYKDRSTGRC